MSSPDPRHRQRKMVDIEVTETSGVDHPAHQHPGWVVMKAAPKPHLHLLDAHYLGVREQITAEALYGAKDIKAGESVPMYKDATLGRDECGCLHLTTPHTIQKAASAEFTTHFAAAQEAARTGGAWDGMLTKAEVSFLMGEKPE